MRIVLVLCSLFFWLSSFAQENIKERIILLESSISDKEADIIALTQKVDSLKLLDISKRLEAMGWPDDEGELVRHNALALSYSEEHEMAAWVA
ncbi:MAG TPA: hypothetical protein VJ949_10535, partial [Cryomorphaceae bacterium]|nr:hypothetical protein [Cryomorphaceae bacterium]